MELVWNFVLFITRKFALLTAWILDAIFEDPEAVLDKIDEALQMLLPVWFLVATVVLLRIGEVRVGIVAAGITTVTALGSLAKIVEIKEVREVKQGVKRVEL